VTLALLAALFATASARSLSDLEEWTNAIRLNQTEKVKELLQTPRNLLSQAEEKVGNILTPQTNFQVDVVGYLVANKTIDKKAGWDVLVKFENEWSSLSLHHEVEEALDWLYSRCSDAVTPVSGDVRVQLEKAKNGFQQQVQYLNRAERGFSLLHEGLQPLLDRDDPEARKEAIEAVDTFFSYFEHGLSTQTLSHVSPAINNFYRLWSEKKSGNDEDVYKTAVEEWTKAILAGDKQKVRDLIEVPRTLFKKAYEKGAQVWNLKRLLQPQFAVFILNETVDKKAAFSLLIETASSLQNLKPYSDVLKAEKWFKERSSDEITPVSGDARAWFQKASDAFRQQQEDLTAIEGGIEAVWWWLANLMEAEGPEVEKSVRYLWPAFYANTGLRTGVDALRYIEADLDHFLQSWNPE